jgi:hypothetical protein
LFIAHYGLFAALTEQKITARAAVMYFHKEIDTVHRASLPIADQHFLTGKIAFGFQYTLVRQGRQRADKHYKCENGAAKKPTFWNNHGAIPLLKCDLQKSNQISDLCYSMGMHDGYGYKTGAVGSQIRLAIKYLIFGYHIFDIFI